MQRYSAVAKNVEPKRARVEEAQAMLAASKAKLFEKQSRLAEVEAQVDFLFALLLSILRSLFSSFEMQF